MPRSFNFDLGLGITPDPKLDPKVFDEFQRLYSSLRLLADQVAGDNMLDWVNYAASSTILGWSSFTTKELQYRYLNLNTVLVQFRLIGTSNSTSASFTLPVDNVTYLACPAGLTGDNGVLSSTLGQVICASAASLVQLNKDATGAIWTASGIKSIAGQFIYRGN